MAGRQSGHAEVFPGRLLVQTPVGLNQALDELAAKQHTTRSEVVRRALMREVEVNGVSFGEPEREAV